MPLLPLKTFAGPNTPLYAPAGSGGGGGGGVGPNPSFSSISLAAGPSGFPNIGPGVINFTNAIGFNNAPDQMTANLYSPANGAVGWQLTTPANDGGIIIGGDGSAAFINSLYNRPINIGVDGGGAPVIVSSLTVSSINGATPGGGGSVAGGIAVSSITSFPGQATPSTILMAPGPGGNFALTGYPTTNNPNGDILLDTGIPANALATNFQPGGSANGLIMFSPSAADTNLNLGATNAGGALIAAVDGVSGNPSTLTVCSDNVKFLQPIAAGAPLAIQAVDSDLYSIGVPGQAQIEIGVVGGRKQMYATVGEVDDLMVSTIVATAGSKVQILDPLIVSAIDGVTTINGAAYPPAASGPTRTQVATLANVSVPGTGSATVISQDFTPTNGHLYTLTGQVYGQVSPNVAAGSQIMFQIGNNGSVYQAPFPANGLITPFGTNILDVNMTWRHNTTGAERLYCYFWDPTNGANASTFTNAVANMDLIDFGPVT